MKRSELDIMNQQSKILDRLTEHYGYSTEHLRELFKVPPSERLHVYFSLSLNKMTLRGFQTLCELMIDEKPYQVLDMILFAKSNIELLQILAFELRTAEMKELIEKKKEKSSHQLLLNILNAKNFEDRKEAIIAAENIVNGISFGSQHIIRIKKEKQNKTFNPNSLNK